jgi:dipeptidyl aminopeptidase/acylaminoacyl peptidase
MATLPILLYLRMRNSILLCCLLLSFVVQAQEDIQYKQPSPEILELADYQMVPSVTMDTKREYMVLRYRNTYKSLDDLNQDEIRLAGLRVNPKLNISSTQSYFNSIRVRKVGETQVEPRAVQGLPDNPKIANMQWSPDDLNVAFTHTSEDGVELWVLDIVTAIAKKLCDQLNANISMPYQWYRDSQSLLVRTIPSNRPELMDTKKEIPKGPIVSVSEGKVSQNRTYTDLLKNKTDESNFETLLLAELQTVSLNGTKTTFKPAGLYIAHSLSPDGNYVMVTTVSRPYSYIVPLSRFPQETKVYDKTGKEIKVVNQVPLNEIIPKGFAAVRKGKRSMSWRSDLPASLYYVEALDEGDPSKKVEERDALYTWDAPFTATPKMLMKTKQRFGGVVWGDAEVAIVADSWYDTRNEKTYLINPSQMNENPIVIFDRNSQDIYSDPGNFETRENEWGMQVLARDKNSLYLNGDGYTEKGQFPFLDEFDINTRKTKRVYQSIYTDKKLDILSIEDTRKGLALAMLQSKSDFPNYYFLNYKQKNKMDPITQFANPFIKIKDVHKEVISYKRDDGTDLSGTLYLPLNYEKGKKYPLLVWAYPEEFKDKSSAGQNNKNPNEFTFPNYGSFIYWVTKGYVVLDDASFPIIGEGTKEPNDNFIEQLVANGKAAIDAVDRLGYIDRTKVAVGGHSYGAFMTANLLTHCDYFTCGIARSGAYNRTLTPFGFQSEQRNYWDVPEVYNGMSPFMNAAKMKKPLLLIHGDADNNPGTFTLQTERYFQALKGLGANARMVLLPKESHGYAAKESILHVLWEQEQFLDKHLKPQTNKP